MQSPFNYKVSFTKLKPSFSPTNSFLPQNLKMSFLRKTINLSTTVVGGVVGSRRLLNPLSNPSFNKTTLFSTQVTTSMLPKCVSLGGSISKDTWRWRIKFSDMLEDVNPPSSIIEELYKKIFGNRRSQKELEFKSRKSEDGFYLFLNVSGCSATEVEVKLNGRFVSVDGEGKALSSTVKKYSKGISVPDGVKFDRTKVRGFVQKGQLQVFFPSSVVDEKLDYDPHYWHRVECVDLPWIKETGEFIADHQKESDVDTDELLISFDNWFHKMLVTIGFIQLVRWGIRTWDPIPKELDFETEFNEKGLNVFLNVSGCAAGDLNVMVEKRYLDVSGEGAAMSGPVKVDMCLDFPENFKFDPDLVRAFYMKGELHVVFPYSKDWMDLKKSERYPIPSSNLPQK